MDHAQASEGRAAAASGRAPRAAIQRRRDAIRDWVPRVPGPRPAGGRVRALLCKSSFSRPGNVATARGMRRIACQGERARLSGSGRRERYVKTYEQRRRVRQNIRTRSAGRADLGRILQFRAAGRSWGTAHPGPGFRVPAARAAAHGTFGGAHRPRTPVPVLLQAQKTRHVAGLGDSGRD